MICSVPTPASPLRCRVPELSSLSGGGKLHALQVDGMRASGANQVRVAVSPSSAVLLSLTWSSSHFRG